MLFKIIPKYYHQLFSSELLNFPMIEKRADCSKCSLAEGRSPDKRAYLPHLKCCTFHPFKPNYVLGQILLDKNIPVEVKLRIETKIEELDFAIPIGMLAPLNFQLDFSKRKAGDFGNRADWLCPYYDTQKNNCGVWDYRTSVCTSFHCLSSYGKLGFEFWEKLEDFMSYLEMTLMEEILLELNFTSLQIMDQISFLKPKSYRNWNKINQNEIALKFWSNVKIDKKFFYKNSFEIIKNLDRKSFLKKMGEQGKSLEKELLVFLKTNKISFKN